jgi:hypothetical protein
MFCFSQWPQSSIGCCAYFSCGGIYFCLLVKLLISERDDEECDPVYGRGTAQGTIIRVNVAGTKNKNVK